MNNHYTGHLSIINNTKDNYFSDKTLVISMRFLIAFNNVSLYLDNNFTKQILNNSPAVKEFIYDEVINYCRKYKHEINQALLKTCVIKQYPEVKIQVIGKYLFIKIFAGTNSSINDCLKALRDKFNNKENIIEVLYKK